MSETMNESTEETMNGIDAMLLVITLAEQCIGNDDAWAAVLGAQDQSELEGIDPEEFRQTVRNAVEDVSDSFARYQELRFAQALTEAFGLSGIDLTTQGEQPEGDAGNGVQVVVL